MNYLGSDAIMLSRDVDAVAIPAGDTVKLPKGTEVAITQALGGTYTLMVPTYGGLFRLADKDADAVGKEARVHSEVSQTPLLGEELEKEVWTRLKTCYDPEIPVNIVDLGLIYAMEIKPIAEGEGNRVDVKMTLTAQGCGMGGSIAADAQGKILGIPGVKEADVQVVWEPPWTPEKISPEGRTLLGIH
jgi:probable FeS assembly SUF system protein SufT